MDIGSFFKSIMNSVSNVSKKFNAPSYLTWFVIPFVVASVLIGFLFYLLFRKWTVVTVCQEKSIEEEEEIVVENVCEEKEFKAYVRVLIGVIATLIISSSVAFGVYKTAVYVKNPNVAMGIEGTRMLFNVFKSSD